MIAGIVGGMPDTHQRFLLSFQRGAPEWTLLEVEHAQTLPAVRWQMRRLDRLEEVLGCRSSPGGTTEIGGGMP